MFSARRNQRALAAAASGGVIAIATLLGTGLCVADSNWTITVKNASKVAVDVTIFLDSKAVGSKASAVKPDGGTATIAIPATGPANKSKYSWKAEYGGKTCGSHSVEISGNTTVNVTCDAAPTASTAPPPKPADSSSSQPKPAPPPNLRLKTPAEMEKEIDEAQKDLVKVNDELEKVDSEAKLKALKDRADKDRDTINRIKTILNGPQRSVIETTPQDWTTVKQKTTDAGDKIDAIEKSILGCKPTGDAVGGDSSGSGSNAPPPTNIDSGTKGKHVVGCKKAF
jgi:hypothetical protein